MSVVAARARTKVLVAMVDRWKNTTGEQAFRFFSPEQVDQILRQGLQQGRRGSHAAIERILKHELGLPRNELWSRIRQLKNSARHAQPRHCRSVWSPEDERILRGGYQAGWRGKREAVCQILKRHADWRPHVIWKHAASLNLVQRDPKRGQERSRLTWSDGDEGVLLDLAGYKSARVIAKVLHRSEAAVRYRLTLLGKSSRTHREGFARSAIAKELHFSTRALQRFIAEGLLQVRDPRITRESLDRFCRAGNVPMRPENSLEDLSQTEESQLEATPSPNGGASPAGCAISSKASRAKRAWTETAESLRLPLQTVENLVARGALKLYDPRITEKSLTVFCRRHGSLINSDFLSRETRDWLTSTMNFVPGGDERAAECLKPWRKHAQTVRRCNCGREIRGNAFFRHVKHCLPRETGTALKRDIALFQM